MSKSLKNFITIKQILKDFNPRQVRFLFLLHTWSALMNYTTEKSLPEAVSKEAKFTEFFRTVKAALRNTNIGGNSQKWNAKDEELSASL
jgi:cysteinyl-tRNA synthetase